MIGDRHDSARAVPRSKMPNAGTQVAPEDRRRRIGNVEPGIIPGGIINQLIPLSADETEGEGYLPAGAKTILLFSPDIDFCASFRMLFQDRYHIVTTTDASMLETSVRALEPELLIADTFPTDRMKRRFSLMKKEDQDLRIMLLYVPPLEDYRLREALRSFVDASFSKPIDLTEISRCIEELVAAG